MNDIDKKDFGAFVAQLRREQGMTQKELAGRLYISDKAVSKWETGVSIPDVALLIPLSENLGVTVTELLLCRRVEEEKPLAVDQVEDIVKTAMTYGEEKPLRAYMTKEPRGRCRFFLAALLGLAGVVLCGLRDAVSLLAIAVTPYLLAALFGGYFWFLIWEKLPRYYDENKVCVVSDGAFQLHMPGMHFNNRNWPYIIRFVRRWSEFTMIAAPAGALLGSFLPKYLHIPVVILIFVLFMVSLFVGLYKVGKKHQ